MLSHHQLKLLMLAHHEGIDLDLELLVWWLCMQDAGRYGAAYLATYGSGTYLSVTYALLLRMMPIYV